MSTTRVYYHGTMRASSYMYFYMCMYVFIVYLLTNVCTNVSMWLCVYVRICVSTLVSSYAPCCLPWARKSLSILISGPIPLLVDLFLFACLLYSLFYSQVAQEKR